MGRGQQCQGLVLVNCHRGLHVVGENGPGADRITTSRTLPEAVDGLGSDDRVDSRIYQKWWSMDGRKRYQPGICRRPFVHPMCMIRSVFIMVTECRLSL